MTENEYSISQISCAAFLVCAGHQLLRLEPMGNGKRLCRFIFEHDPRIAESRMRFWEYQATVDPRKFAEVMTGLKKKAVDKTQESMTDGNSNPQ
jgi:hypothetical protein